MAYFHFRLFLRPTVIGKAIIDRLSLEGADRQADARRWLELGYAAELAGFRLDGTTISQVANALTADNISAGNGSMPLPQAASTQPARVFPPSQDLGQVETGKAGGVSEATASVETASSSKPAAESTAVESPQPVPTGSNSPAQVVPSSPIVDEMTNNLRGLSA